MKCFVLFVLFVVAVCQRRNLPGSGSSIARLLKSKCRRFEDGNDLEEKAEPDTDLLAPGKKNPPKSRNPGKSDLGNAVKEAATRKLDKKPGRFDSLKEKLKDKLKDKLTSKARPKRKAGENKSNTKKEDKGEEEKIRSRPVNVVYNINSKCSSWVPIVKLHNCVHNTTNLYECQYHDKVSQRSGKRPDSSCFMPEDLRCDGVSACATDECGCEADEHVFYCSDGTGCIAIEQVWYCCSICQTKLPNL